MPKPKVPEKKAAERQSRNSWTRNVHSRWRLFACIALGLACYFVLPAVWNLSTRALTAWNVGIISFMAVIIFAMSNANAASIRKRAEEVDEGRYIVLALTIIAAIAALIGVVAQLSAANDIKGAEKSLHIGLAILTIVSSWSFIHLVFAEHYAHEFFIERDSEKELAPEDRGGLRFPGGQPPVFTDFLYFSFVIGVACQTADVSIPSRPMRRLATIHCILAFVFNTTVLALTINIAAGLLASK